MSKHRKCCNTLKGQHPHEPTCSHSRHAVAFAKSRDMGHTENVAGQILANVGQPNWDFKCTVCGATPVVSGIGLCGPCCFGEAATAGGNW